MIAATARTHKLGSHGEDTRAACCMELYENHETEGPVSSRYSCVRYEAPVWHTKGQHMKASKPVMSICVLVPESAHPRRTFRKCTSTGQQNSFVEGSQPP
jgi:hypothetical protein